MAVKKYWKISRVVMVITSENIEFTTSLAHNKHSVGVTDFSISKNEACPHEMNSHHWMLYSCTM